MPILSDLPAFQPSFNTFALTSHVSK